MSAAALVQRLRNGSFPGTGAAVWNGWNGSATPVSFQQKQAAPEGETPSGTDGTGGTGVLVGVGKEGDESRPQRPDPYAIGAPWRPLTAAYYRHHFACPSCCAAGHGRGTRCTAGAELWASYEAACEATQATNTQGRRAR
jgi:hypothetical protein